MVILPSLYPFLPAFLSLLRVEGVAFSIDSIGICGVAAGSLRLALIALVLLGFTGFYRVLPGFTGFYRIVLLNMNWVSHISETFIEFYRTCTALLPSFTKFYRVIPNFTEYDLVLPSFT